MFGTHFYKKNVLPMQAGRRENVCSIHLSSADSSVTFSLQ